MTVVAILLLISLDDFCSQLLSSSLAGCIVRPRWCHAWWHIVQAASCSMMACRCYCLQHVYNVLCSGGTSQWPLPQLVCQSGAAQAVGKANFFAYRLCHHNNSGYLVVVITWHA
jgi:hypothetical protein